MDGLIEGSIPAFFHGISRQPDTMRLPGQVEDALNVTLSVESGGFEKRPGGRLLATLSGLGTAEKLGVHLIDRDASERYALLHRANGTLRVVSLLTGTEHTVQPLSDSARAYLSGDPETDFAWVTVADYTLIANRKHATAMSTTPEPTPPPTATLFVSMSQGTTQIHVGGAVVDYIATPSDTVAATAAKIGEKLRAAVGSAFWIVWSSSFIILRRHDGADFTIDVFDGGGYVKVVKDSVAGLDELPARCQGGTVYSVRSVNDSGFYVRFEQHGGDMRGTWRETVAPGSKGRIDANTMPHALVRQADGTFVVKQLSWAARPCGDDRTNPVPEFIGRPIADMVFHRNRLVLVSDESVHFSQAGDYFNFWSEWATQVLDSDAFGLTAATNSVALLRFAAPFRKTLFLAADTAQFEVNSPDVLTPKRASIDLATTYKISPRARPSVVGNALLMGSDGPASASILEYAYNDGGATLEAVDIVKHASGLIPAPLKSISGDAVTGNLVVLSAAAPRDIFMHTFFWHGESRAQSAWHRWTFGADRIHSAGIVGTAVIVVMARGADVVVQSVDLARSRPAEYPYTPGLDMQVSPYGVYDAAADETVFDLPYRAHDEPRLGCVPSLDFATRSMPEPLTDAANPNRIRVRGDWTAGPIAWGLTYDSEVTLSRIYPRGEDKSAVLEGRLQLRSLTLAYTDTAHFDVIAQPEARAARLARFRSQRTSHVANRISTLPLVDGRFRFTVMSRADTVRITIRNASPHPFTITSASWVGFYADPAQS